MLVKSNVFDDEESTVAAKNPLSPVEAWTFVAFFSFILILSVADRLALTMMVEPIKAELHLSDVQFGLLVGTAFATVFALSSLPLSWLADRWNRKALLFVGVAFWSGMTLLSGYARSYEVLLISRFGLAMGEAVLAPVGISLMGDLFSPEKRAVPTAVYLSSATVGASFAYLSAGYITALGEGGAFSGWPLIAGLAAWRATLVILGVAGCVIALALLLLTREPQRAAVTGATHHLPGSTAEREAGGAFGSLRGSVPFFGLFFLACSFTGMLTYAVAAWYPTHLMRFFSYDARQAGEAVGFVYLIGGTGGGLLVPAFIQGLMRRGRKHVLVSVAMALTLVGGVAFLITGWQSSATASFAAALVAIFCVNGISSLPQIVTVLTAPARFRGRVAATAILMTNLIGLGVGPVFVAWLGEHFFTGRAAIGQALGVAGVCITPVAFVLMGAARFAYRRANFL